MPSPSPSPSPKLPYHHKVSAAMPVVAQQLWALELPRRLNKETGIARPLPRLKSVCVCVCNEYAAVLILY